MEKNKYNIPIYDYGEVLNISKINNNCIDNYNIYKWHKDITRNINHKFYGIRIVKDYTDEQYKK